MLTLPMPLHKAVFISVLAVSTLYIILLIGAGNSQRFNEYMETITPITNGPAPMICNLEYMYKHSTVIYVTYPCDLSFAYSTNHTQINTLSGYTIADFTHNDIESISSVTIQINIDKESTTQWVFSGN